MKNLAVKVGCGAALFWVTFIIANASAYIHAFIFTIQHHEIVLFLVGLFPPIGVIHGWLLWFGLLTQ